MKNKLTAHVNRVISKVNKKVKTIFLNFYQKGILSDSLEGNSMFWDLLLCDALPIMPWDEFLTTYVTFDRVVYEDSNVLWPND